MKNVDIVIVHYGDVATTKECIKTTEKLSSEFRRLIIVNNDPDIDLSLSFPSSKNIHIINTGKNIGFAAGVNVGIQESLAKKAEYIMLLNNDAKPYAGAIRVLTEYLENHTQTGIAGPVIEFETGGTRYFDYGGVISVPLGKTYHHNEIRKRDGAYYGVDYISGCCMMIKAVVFEKIGLFDERFFMYYEDADFCLRAKREGYDIRVVNNAAVFHELSKTVGKSSGFAQYQLLKSGRLFGEKYKNDFWLYRMQLLLQSVKFAIRSPKNVRSIITAWR